MSLRARLHDLYCPGLGRWLSGKESPCQFRRHKRHGFDPWFGKSPGGRYDNPLQYLCLENSMDRGAWRATVQGVSKSWTRLNDWALTHSEATQCHPCCTLSLKKVPRAHHVSMGRDVDPHLLTQEWRGWGKSVRWRYFVANVRKYNVPHTLQNISFCSCNPLSYLNITSNLLVMLLPKSFLVPFPHQDRRLQCTHTNQNTSIVYMRVGHCSVWHSSQNDNTL